MHRSKSLLLLLTILSTLFIIPTHQTNENQLLNHLLKDHSPFARPVRNASRPVFVTFGFELVHIVSIVESEQTITQKVWLRMAWKNEFLTWDPNLWGGVTKSRLDISAVWTPDIFLHEDVSDDMATGPEKFKTQVVIEHDGSNSWYVPTLFQSSCIFNVAPFPFDRQSCTFVFTPWTHDQTEVDLIVDERPVITTNYINSSEWDLQDVTSKLVVTKYQCCPNNYVNILYTIKLRRKPLYYIYSVIVPCIIQMVIILFTFFLPPDSGERIGVVITVLLVFAVYLEVLSHTLPRTSTSTPALSRFYIAAMAESACSLIATCLVLIIHFKGTEKGVRPMPQWAKEYLLDGLAHALCVRRNERETNDERTLSYLSVQRGSYAGLSNGVNNHNNHSNNSRLSSTTNTLDNSHHRRHSTHQKMDFNQSKGEDLSVAMEMLVQEVRVITALINDQNRQDEIEEEWQSLAKICDRLFFVLFLLIFMTSSLILLLPVYIESLEP